MWLCLTEFNQIRHDESIAIASDAKYIEAEKRLFESKNFQISCATENYKHLHFQSTIKNLQSLSDALRVKTIVQIVACIQQLKSFHSHPYRAHRKIL